MNFLIRLLKLFFKLLVPSIKYRVKISRKFFGDKKTFELMGIKYIDELEVDRKVNYNISGIFEGQRTPKLIVSLTSYPARMVGLKYALYSLLNQNLKPNEIVLWLSYEEFSDKENSVSDDILNFRKNGLLIKFCHDLKSYKKLIPSLREYMDCIIATADDDIYYEKNWLEKLYAAYLKEPQYIHCHRSHEILFDKNGKLKPYNSWKHGLNWNQVKPSFMNFFTGVGGVLYPPYSLHQNILDEELFLKLAPTADDIWFWAMAVLQGTKINIVKENILNMIELNLIRELVGEGCSLQQTNVFQGKNDEQLENVLNKFPEIRSMILGEKS